MSTTIIELNDSEIRTAQDTEIISRHPGYAVLLPDRIETGIAAWKIARSNPRQTTNRYWSQLNQDTLNVPSRLARHNADIAYTQLMTIHEHAGKPDEVIFTVPGSYNREELSLLLGIVEACPFTAIGLVDSAVAGAAAMADRGQYNHLDIYLHYALITSLDVTDQVLRKAVKTIDNVGISDIYDTCAETIADLYIDQTRFDPLHHAETEQTLYSYIPQLLADFKTAEEATLEIPFDGKHYQVKIPAELILDKLNRHYEKIYREIAGPNYCLVSDRLNILPGFSDKLNSIVTLDEYSVFKGCQNNLDKIRSSGPALSFITLLPAAKTTQKPTNRTKTETKAPDDKPLHKSVPTHVLMGNQAYPLGRQSLYIGTNNAVEKKKADTSHCSITPRNGTVSVHPESDLNVYVNGHKISSTKPVNSGDTISIPDCETTMKFIEVLPD
jgi:hypothetical protein